jgi:HD-GYP domain-containing protein (c-di-GMP phosphodiesterase class II)
MNVVNTYDLKPGQIFSMPVYTEGECLLVPQLVPLRQKDIDLLVSCGIEEVRTEGALVDPTQKKVKEEEEVLETVEEVDTPDIPDLSDLLNISSIPDVPDIPPDLPDFSDIKEEKKETIKFSISDVKTNSGPYRAYKNLIDKLNSVFTGIKSGLDVQINAINNICVHLLQDLRDHPDNYVDYILGGEVSGHELAKSSVNTAILSALIAQGLKLPNHKIHNIVAGALLHDVGMLRLSKGITEKKGGLSEAELEQIKSHPGHSSKIVTKELFGGQEVNMIALQHHERWDGKGYPNSLQGDAIDIGARIVSVADAFEAMVSKKSYRNSLIGYQAIKNLMADNGSRFDPAVISIFTKIMGIYPIGSIVKLNNGAIGRVISVHTDAPLRPIIQMLMDERGKVLDTRDPTTIDLLVQKTLFIKNAIDPAYYNEEDG